ncbi:MAG: porin family protein [Deltaproteobacteria bacterium]|nr:porin family protein [Deltaproteobacteria bacterium]
MKKTVIVLLALFVPATLWAMDINQGTIELSGKTAFDFSDTTTEVTGSPDIDETSYSFQIDGLYYLQNNLGLGLIFEYEETEFDSIDSSTFIIGPQVTYNFPLGEKVSLFVNGAVGYATAEVEDFDADGWAFQLGGGLKYFLTNSASINGAVTYQNLSLEADSGGGDIDTSGIHVGIGLSIYF